MREKFSRIRSPWYRLYISLLIVFFYFRDKLRSSRARNHWIGRQRRPRRYERMLTIGIILCSIAVLEPRDLAVWSIMWGGVLSIFVTIHSLYILIPRKRAHRVKL